MTTRFFAFSIPGPPQGQGRGRVGVNRGTGRAQVFTPAKTRSYAQMIGGEWIAAGRPVLCDGPYRVSVSAYHKRPASHFKANGDLSAAGRRAQHPGKPDLDNVLKGVLDALVACGAVPDDRMMVSVAGFKMWAEGEGPRIFVQAMSYVVPEVVA